MTFVCAAFPSLDTHIAAGAQHQAHMSHVMSSIRVHLLSLVNLIYDKQGFSGKLSDLGVNLPEIEAPTALGF
ncbi:uncharacterized protein UV8b_07498 [Ustilaginoidea virens]|uniref:Uncharacterized protein n=1 Tax=Ustilaginoidea virens TaxID=1159556 RepID=A0A8E5ML25_USTVR|nr:uncharacterized protein UV8b_07498 [Ustilaginoidea virens]QUC23257.1 hypothetical protein UV8b_07498 [Ustilaginoidea virens]